MDWRITLFLALCGCSAFYAGYVAYRCRRDASNWHIDIESKDLTFHGWAEYLFAMVICFIGSGIVILAAVL